MDADRRDGDLERRVALLESRLHELERLLQLSAAATETEAPAPEPALALASAAEPELVAASTAEPALALASAVVPESAATPMSPAGDLVVGAASTQSRHPALNHRRRVPRKPLAGGQISSRPKWDPTAASVAAPPEGRIVAPPIAAPPEGRIVAPPIAAANAAPLQSGSAWSLNATPIARPAAAPVAASTPAPIAGATPASTQSGAPWGPTAAPTASRVVAPRPTLDLRDLEERFAGRALAWIGGVALVAAAIFFLSLAFSRGWINEPMRVAIGLVAGSAALALGALSFDRRNPLVGNVLTAVGLGVVSIALFAATRAYGLVAPEIGLAGALLAAITAAVIAIRYDAREVAAFGLVAALIAPPVMGASPTALTLAFVAVTLVGTTAIALFRSWRWLPPIAFILSAPQLADWLLGGADTGQGLVAIVGFWLVNVIAAAGEEVRIRRDDLRPSSATLVLANASFLTWGGYIVLHDDLHLWLGLFIALASAAHLAIGAAFLRRQGMEHLFGNLVAGTGVALLALAAFEQLGAALVPVAWSAEAAALAWLAVRRVHRWSALAATVLGALAITHLLLVEYPVTGLADLPVYADAWRHPEAASLAAVVGAMAVAAWFVPVAWIRSVLIAVGAALVAYAAPFEVGGPALPTIWVVAAVAALVLDRAVMHAGTRPDLAAIGRMVDSGAGTASAAILGVLALGHLVTYEYPLDTAGLRATPAFATPWLHADVVPVIAMLGAAVVAGWMWPVRLVRTAATAAGALLVGYVLTFEAGGALLIALLWIVGIIATELDPVMARLGTRPDLARLDRFALGAWLGTMAGAWLRLTAIAVLLLVEYPLPEFSTPVASTPYTGEAALSLAIVLVGLALLGWRVGGRQIRSAMAGLGILLVAWTVPFELDGPARIAMLAVLLPVGVLLDRAIERLPGAQRFAFLKIPTEIGGLAGGAGAIAWAGGLLAAVAGPMPTAQWGRVAPPAIPFSDEAALVAVILAGAAIAAAAWAARRETRQLGLFGALVPLGLVLPLEVYADFVVVGWLLLAGAALLITRPGDPLRAFSGVLAGLLGGAAAFVTFAIVAPPDRLWVVDPDLDLRQPLLAGWWVAVASVAALPALASRRPELASYRSWLEVAAAALGVYLVSVAVVDVFQRQVGGQTTVEELAKQAQVALSVTWTAIGAAALAVGLRTRHAMARHIGFGLLAIATAKVFVVDLAAMDVAYRALVLAGLGVLLLLSAWLFSNLHGPHPGTHGPRPVG